MMDPRNDITNRLKTISGHINGVIRMIEDGRDCHEILHQLQAIKSSLATCNVAVIENYLQECLSMSEENQKEVQQLLKMMK